MEIIQKLYTVDEVKTIIVDTVGQLVSIYKAADSVDLVGKVTKMKQWADSMYPAVQGAVVEEVVRRHVQGVTFAIWAGPPGSGKGTNIETVQWLGRVYAEVVSQGGAAQLPEFVHKTLLGLSLSQGSISTGTRGMFNLPEGEYAELFGDLGEVIAEHVAKGNFVGDSIVSLLVSLMVLLRLVQGYHRIQIDLWPRTVSQFRAYKSLVSMLQRAGAKIEQEIVSIKVLPDTDVALLMSEPLEAAKKSIELGHFLEAVMNESWYQESVVQLSQVADVKARFAQEGVLLQKVMEIMKQSCTDTISASLVRELAVVVERMTFRFNKALETGSVPRTDEYPLSLMKRLSIYTIETSTAFLFAAADTQDGVPVHIISSFSTPEVVIGTVLDKLVGQNVDDSRWGELKKVAGEIAVDLVNRKTPIVEPLLQRVGGILNS
jgi:hypothetical protein